MIHINLQIFFSIKWAIVKKYWCIKLSENSEKCSKKSPKAQGDNIKLLVSIDQRSKTQRYSVFYHNRQTNRFSSHFRLKNDKQLVYSPWCAEEEFGKRRTEVPYRGLHTSLICWHTPCDPPRQWLSNCVAGPLTGHGATTGGVLMTRGKIRRASKSNEYDLLREN